MGKEAFSYISFALSMSCWDFCVLGLTSAIKGKTSWATDIPSNIAYLTSLKIHFVFSYSYQSAVLFGFTPSLVRP